MDDLDRLNAWLDATLPAPPPTASTEIAIGRTRARIDRALDVRNRREFMRLCALLRGYKARL